MHSLNHENILSLRLLADNSKIKGKGTLSIAAFVELYAGELWSILDPNQCVDAVHHVPSPRLRKFLRDIVIAIDFLRKNGFYHGNLSWKSTLYFDNTVKLAGFKMNDSEDPQWGDWLCFINMLEEIPKRLKESNDVKSTVYYTGNIDSLIAMLKTLDRSSLLTIAEIILKDPFFWDLQERVEFFAHHVSLKLNDKNFLQTVRGSAICQKSWDVNGTYDFQRLVKKMNDHRDGEEKKRLRYKKGARKRGAKKNGVHYDGDSPEDYVKCVRGAYTHSKQIQLDVDHIVRGNQPTICIDMKRIIEASENLASGCAV